jgi:hypothetical protein
MVVWGAGPPFQPTVVPIAHEDSVVV